MKIFISWSGDASHVVAKALKAWLPNVFQTIESSDVFLSSSDISVGTQWFNELGRVLEESEFGVLCLTRENVSRPWVLYEAGAVAKHFKTARVAPLLIGITKHEVPSPLVYLQGAELDRNGVQELLTSINQQLGDNKLTEQKLDSAFKAFWPQLEPAVRDALAKAARTNAVAFDYDVFLSAPMAAFATDAAYVEARADVLKVFNALRDDCGMRVYWAGERIAHVEDFDTIDVSVIDDLRALEGSRYFVLLYPSRLATSALFEAGYALALKRVSHYFVRERNDLPFLLRELPGAVSGVRIHTGQDWKDWDDLARKLKRNKDAWFPKP